MGNINIKNLNIRGDQKHTNQGPNEISLNWHNFNLKTESFKENMEKQNILYGAVERKFVYSVWNKICYFYSSRIFFFPRETSVPLLVVYSGDAIAHVQRRNLQAQSQLQIVEFLKILWQDSGLKNILLKEETTSKTVLIYPYHRILSDH